MTVRDHPWVAALFFVAVVYATYEPAARAAYLPVLRDTGVYIGFGVIACIAMWYVIYLRRREFWSPQQSQYRALKVAYIAFAAITLPFFLTALVVSYTSWITYYFGTTPVTRQLVIEEVTYFRKLRRPFVEIVGRDSQINEKVNLEWAVAENPSMPKPHESWVGKTVCIHGVSAWPGTLVQRIESCPRKNE